MTGTKVIQAENVSKRFVIRKDKSLKERVVQSTLSRQHRDEFWALQGVDLEVEAGSTVGLIGPNGSGKSTLLKVIGGIIQPTSGQVLRRGRLAALLELGAGFHPDLTGRDNVYLNASILGLTRKQTDRYFDAIVDFSGIERFIDTQVKFYSSGMYVRLAFAVAVHVDPDVLLVDEVLAVGDEPFQRKCMDRIRSFQREGRTIVLVTHALDQVIDVCDRAVVLEEGRVVLDGTAREATRTLRSDFAAAREQEQHDAEAVSDRHAQVVAVDITDAFSKRIDVIRSGQDLRVTVTVEADNVLRDWVVGIGIDTSGGQNIYGTNTQLLGVPLPEFSGRHQVEVMLHDVHIGAGEYHVHGAIAQWSGPEIHRLSEGATLKVDADGESIGVLGIKATIQRQ